MIIIGVVGNNVKRNASVFEHIKKDVGEDVQVVEVGRWLGNPELCKAKYFRDQLARLKQEGFNGVVVFTRVLFHEEFAALAAKGGVMWHMVTGVSDCIPIRLGVDKLVSIFYLANRPHYLTPGLALDETLAQGIRR